MMNYEILEKVDAQRYFEEFPRIDAKAITMRVNELFTPYLFYHRERKDEIQLWASCCGRHGRMDKIPRTIGPVEGGIVFGKHNDKVTCPYCGKEVTLKNTSKLGKKRTLLEYIPVIILSAKNGDLYARCYWARKDYQGNLEDMPKFMDTYALHFAIGKSESFYEIPVSDSKTKIKHETVEENFDPVHRVITEPFTTNGGLYNSIRYVPYHIIGLEEIAKSDFRYSQYERFEYDKGPDGTYSDFCKYFTAFSIYPKQIEMLMKTGGESIVNDLVRNRRKNRKIIQWKAETPFDAFQMDKTELRDFRKSGCDYYAMEDYKQLRRKKLLTSFAILHKIDNLVGVYVRGELVQSCIQQNIHPEKLIRYLDRFTGTRCYGGIYSLDMAYRNWNDYVVMASALGYDLTVETVLMPRNLDLAHNEAQTEITLRNERIAGEASGKEMLSILQRQKKYNFELDGFFVRIARSSEEIVAEGKTLVHCVGGYAERHMRGTTTILFLRRSDEPGVSLYTIQMDGDKLIQIHGFKNECLGNGKYAPNPANTMKWFLDPWIEWLKKGSPRREDGTARIPKHKEAKSA